MTQILLFCLFEILYLITLLKDKRVTTESQFPQMVNLALLVSFKDKPCVWNQNEYEESP